MEEIEAESLQCLAIWWLYASESALKQQRFSCLPESGLGLDGAKYTEHVGKYVLYSRMVVLMRAITSILSGSWMALALYACQFLRDCIVSWLRWSS
jgi:hypothetical protein